MWTADIGSQIFISFVGGTRDGVDSKQPSFSFHIDLVPYSFTVPNEKIDAETISTVDIHVEENVSRLNI